MRGGQHDREDERVDQQEQEWIDEGPDETERRAAIARLELACDQAGNEGAVLEEVSEAVEQPLH